jgi:hypothetical protein
MESAYEAATPCGKSMQVGIASNRPDEIQREFAFSLTQIFVGVDRKVSRGFEYKTFARPFSTREELLCAGFVRT